MLLLEESLFTDLLRIEPYSTAKSFIIIANYFAVIIMVYAGFLVARKAMELPIFLQKASIGGFSEEYLGIDNIIVL